MHRFEPSRDQTGKPRTMSSCCTFHMHAVPMPSRGRFRTTSATDERRTLCAAKKAGTRKGGGANQGKPDEVAKQKQLLSALAAPAKDDAGDATGARVDDEEEDMGITLVKKGKPKTQHTVEQLQGSLYSYPRIYDWAFGYRDYEQEVKHCSRSCGATTSPRRHRSLVHTSVTSSIATPQVDFLFDVYEEIIGDEPLSFLELGCGPAQHSLEMAESKLRVFCVDMQAQMLEYAAALAAEDGLEMTCIEGDMREFKLPVRPSPTCPASASRPCLRC